MVINSKFGTIESARVFDTYKDSTEFDEFIQCPIPESFVVAAAC